MEAKEKKEKDLSIKEMKQILKLMKEEGVIAFTFKGLSVNFSQDVIYKEIYKEELKKDENVQEPETEEQRARRIQLQEEEDLYGSSL